MELSHVTTGWLWPAALGAIPVAVVVAAVCRAGMCRASTRHALWVVVLACFLVTPLVPRWRLSGVTSVAHVESASLEREALPRERAADTSAAPFKVEERVAALGPASRPIAGGPRGVLARSVSARGEEAVGGFREPRADDVRPEAAAARDPVVAADVSPMEPPAAFGPGSDSGATFVESTGHTADAGPAAVTPAEAEGMSGSHSWWGSWAGMDAWARWTLRLRDAVATLPPVPAAAWIGGAVLIVLTAGIRVAMFRRVLRRASSAPTAVRGMVEGAASEIGLRRVPGVLMTDLRVSPMIWCGRQCRLVLPRGLWDELDDVGRRAVILHELAHVRRRDHWVRWAEVAASVLYWWHPVVWWARRRLREEADLCCDAWVTALLPWERRAYAEALVRTRSFLSRGGDTPPVVGLGVMTPSAERFARRLTMVMKARPNPRLSTLGVGASLALALAASSTTSLWACPPGEEGKAQATAAVVQPVPAKAPKPPRAPQPPEPTVAAPLRTAPALGGVAEIEQPRALITEPAGSVDDRLRELEKRLERLDTQLKRLEQLLDRSGRAGPRTEATTPAPPMANLMRGGQAAAAGSAPLTMSRGRDPLSPRTAAGVLLPTPDASGGLATHGTASVGMTTVSPGFPGGGVAAARSGHAGTWTSQPSQPGAVVSRSYRLPAGKLEAVWMLMSRNDVPVQVSQDDGAITVHGTPEQQRAFEAFIRIINPGPGAAAGGNDPYRIEVRTLDGLRGAVGAGAAEEQVRRHVEALSEQSRVLASRLAASHALSEQQRHEFQTRLAETMRQVEALRSREGGQSRDEARQIIERLRQSGERLRELRQREGNVSKNKAASMAAEAEKLQKRAEGLESKAEAMQERAEALQDKAQSLSGADHDTLAAQARELQDRARQLEAEAAAIQRQADELSRLADMLQAQAEDSEADDAAAAEAMTDLDESDDAAFAFGETMEVPTFELPDAGVLAEPAKLPDPEPVSPPSAVPAR
jgi:beta-lactamase regulating signal transducer with metallopeptidase domain/archaellum component FlaC